MAVLVPVPVLVLVPVLVPVALHIVHMEQQRPKTTPQIPGKVLFS